MKKVLILTASTGEGHNQAAKTIEGVYTQRGYECHRVDMFKSTHRSMDVLMADGYRILASNLPKMYGTLYKQCDTPNFNSLIARRVLKITEMRLNKVIHRMNPSLIIATHPFAVPVIGHMKAKGRCTQPFIQVVTDFKAHYAYIDPHVDAYITASDFTKSSLIKRGIPEQKVFAYGIPVKPDFLNRAETGVERIATSQRFELLIMGGSMGLKPIRHVVRAVAENPRNIHMTVVCGNNRILKNNLELRFAEYIQQGRMEILGFVSNIPELMARCHVIVTKPGGLTSSEAINMSIPMLIPFSIPGQEQENTDFLVESGMALAVNGAEDINDKINHLMDNPQLYEAMSRNMTQLSANYSIEKIVALGERMMEECPQPHRPVVLSDRRVSFFERIQ